jgi:hypothetical protein
VHLHLDAVAPELLHHAVQRIDGRDVPDVRAPSP